MKISQKDIERFESKFVLIPFHSCWEWITFCDSDGYGHFYYNKKMRIASRISYQIHKGKIPKNMFVCHTCDNPSCVNPHHLWLGTAKQNSQDMVNKNRTHLGETHHNSKLNNSQILEIRKKYKKETKQNKHDGFSYHQLALDYNVSWVTIRNIIIKRIYKHI